MLRLAMTFVVLSWSVQANALTSPVSGAAAKPAGLTLAAPFPCSVTYRVIGGYGDSLHVNINETLKSNDYYALDLVRDEAGSGQGKPVSAVAAGTVKYAGWASGGWSTYGLIVIVELDFNDGHTYQALHAHLDQVLVTVGQKVKARDPVGHLGASGNNNLSYWSSPHLHFAMYRDAKLGSGGPYGGVAMVPEPLDGTEDLVTGSKVTVTCPPSTPDAGPGADAAPPADATAGDGPPDAASPGSDAPKDDLGQLPPVAGDGLLPSEGGSDGCSCAAGAGQAPLPLLPLLLLGLVCLRLLGAG